MKNEYLEKVGLILWVCGIVMLGTIFVLGGGDATHAFYPDGEKISAITPLFMFFIGGVAYLFAT